MEHCTDFLRFLRSIYLLIVWEGQEKLFVKLLCTAFDANILHTGKIPKERKAAGRTLIENDIV